MLRAGRVAMREHELSADGSKPASFSRSLHRSHVASVPGQPETVARHATHAIRSMFSLDVINSTSDRLDWLQILPGDRSTRCGGAAPVR